MNKENNRTSVLRKSMVSRNGEQDTRTPLSLFAELHKEYKFDLDPCTSCEKPNNLGVDTYFTKQQDGLSRDWNNYKAVFINPPFKDMKLWVKKILREIQKNKGQVIVLLAPSKTETLWWHSLLSSPYLQKIEFQKKRVSFEGHKGAFIFGISFFVLCNDEPKNARN